MPSYNIIVCIDKNGGIAKDNKIPWHIPNDLKFFKQMTTGHPIIMGRRTFETIGKPLPNRTNIVITRNIIHDDNILCYDNLNSAIVDLEKKFKNETIYVIGGAQIYKWFLEQNLISKEYITFIYEDYNCDLFYTKDRDFLEHLRCPLDKRLSVNRDYSIKQMELLSVEPPAFVCQVSRANVEEGKFLDLMREVRQSEFYNNRTGIPTKKIFGRQLHFSLENNSFPLITTRKLWLKGIFEELMLYLRGQTDSKILESKGVRVWSGNTSREFLDGRGLNHYSEGDMGATYGFLMRHYGDTYKTCHDEYKGFDQLEWLIKEMRESPDSRRLILDLWRPDDIDKMSLPPCLYQYQFDIKDGKLYCMATQRSSDIVTAGGWNIAQISLLTIMLANVVGLKPGGITWNIGNVHIYENLLEQCDEQLTREPRLFPKLFIKNSGKHITEFELTDFELINYNPHDKIKIIMNP